MVERGLLCVTPALCSSVHADVGLPVNAVVPIYFARFILALVCWHWMGRGIHKPVQVAAARDMEQVAAPTTTPTPLENPQPGSTRPNSGVYQGLPLSEIEEERRQPVASGSAL